jgi:DNA-binding helix-turn-helix protein
METNLKVLVAKKNITIEKLSEEINVSRVTLYRLSNGKLKNPKYETLKKVSSYFGIPTDELLKKETI